MKPSAEELWGCKETGQNGPTVDFQSSLRGKRPSHLSMRLLQLLVLGIEIAWFFFSGPPSVSFSQWQHRCGHGDAFEELRLPTSQAATKKWKFFILWLFFKWSCSTVLFKSRLSVCFQRCERKTKKDALQPGIWTFVLVQNSDPLTCELT